MSAADDFDLTLLTVMYDGEGDYLQRLVREYFSTDVEQSHWLYRQQDLGYLDRGPMNVPDWNLTIDGRRRVEESRERFADRRHRTTALRRQLLIWVDSVCERTGTLEGRIDQFFESPHSYFCGQKFSAAETDDAAAYLEQHDMIKRKGALGTPTLRLGVTATGRDCVIDSDGDVTAHLASQRASAPTFNISNSHAIAIALGDGSTATATSTEQAIDGAVELAEAFRLAIGLLNLDADDEEALDDIESREAGRVKRGLRRMGRYAEATSSNALGGALGSVALQLLAALS